MTGAVSGAGKRAASRSRAASRTAARPAGGATARPTGSRLRTVRATGAVGAATALLVLVSGWFFLVGPATGALGTTRAELVDTQDANRLLGARLARLEAQRDALSEVSTVADDLAVLFPPTADQPGFFGMVDRAARAAGLGPRQVTTLSPTVPVIAGPAGQEGTEDPDPGATSTDGPDPSAGGLPTDLAVQTVVVTVEGTYEQGQRLLAELEQLDRSFLVQSVTVSGEEQQTISITGSTFVAPLVPPPADEVA